MSQSDIGAEPLDVATRNALARAVKARGERAVIGECNVSRATFGRALGGLPVRRGTAALIHARFAQKAE